MLREDGFFSLANDVARLSGQNRKDAALLRRAASALYQASTMAAKMREALRSAPRDREGSHIAAMAKHYFMAGLRAWCSSEFRFPDEVCRDILDQYLALDSRTQDDFQKHLEERGGWQHFFEEVGHPRWAPRAEVPAPHRQLREEAMASAPSEASLRRWCEASFLYPEEVFSHVRVQFQELNKVEKAAFLKDFDVLGGWRYFIEHLAHPRLAGYGWYGRAHPLSSRLRRS